MMPGKPVADAVFADLEPRVAALRAGGRNPGLGTILVGNESASAGYIRMKQDRAASLGFGGRHVHLDDDASQADLVAAIRDFNTDDEVDAVLIQHPIPPHLDYEAALTELDPDKDADGAHPMNMGRLALGMAGPLPCTPAGCGLARLAAGAGVVMGARRPGIGPYDATRRHIGQTQWFDRTDLDS